MAKVVVTITDDENGNVEANVAFDPPLLPGMQVPAAHHAAFGIFKGTALEPAMRVAAGIGVDTPA